MSRMNVINSFISCLYAGCQNFYVVCKKIKLCLTNNCNYYCLHITVRLLVDVFTTSIRRFLFSCQCETDCSEIDHSPSNLSWRQPLLGDWGVPVNQVD